MMKYNPISATPSTQVYSPSKMMTVTTNVETARAATIKGGKTRVNLIGPTAGLRSINTGVRRRATCSGLFSDGAYGVLRVWP